MTKPSKTVEPKPTKALPLTAPRIGEHIAEIGRVLTEWSQETDKDVPEKLAMILDHQYNKDGLTWNALKGADRVKARALAEAAGQSGCHAFLALLTFWESGYSESGDDDDYGWRGREGSRRRDRSWDDEEGNETGTGTENNRTCPRSIANTTNALLARACNC